MGFAVLAAQFLTCSHLRALSELQAPELGACVFTALTRPCVTFHTLPTFPASHHPSLVFPPALWAGLGCAPRLPHVLVPVLGTPACMALEGWDFHASTHGHLEQPGAGFGNCRGRSSPGMCRGHRRGVPAVLPGLPGPGCAFPRLFCSPACALWGVSTSQHRVSRVCGRG